MKKIVVHFLLILTATFFSCSDDEKNDPALKLFVNGKSVEIKEVKIDRYTAGNSTFEIEYLMLQAKVANNKAFVLWVGEVGRYDDFGNRYDGGLRPRTYIINDPERDESDCTEFDEVNYCDSFSLSLSDYLGVNAGQVEITKINSNKKKVTGSFAVTGNKFLMGEGDGEPFSITGEFDSTYEQLP